MIKRLIDVNKLDKEYIGIKAYNSSILLKSDIATVDGFILYGEITQEEFKTADEYMDCNILYAVRSSMSGEDGSIISNAGKYQTILSVKKENLQSAVFHVYRQSGECKNKAVLIQPLVEAEVSGVIFTKNPITGNGLLINAVLGSGENMVSGSETPDEFEIVESSIKSSIQIKNAIFTYGQEKEPGTEIKMNNCRARYVICNEGKLLLSVHLEDNKKPVLNHKQIFTLTKEANKIKQLFCIDQDIEFTYANDMFYFLQARPITTITKPQSDRTNKLCYYAKANQIIKGERVSSGVFKGKAVNIKDQDKIDKLDNIVLVTDELYPEMIYQIKNIGAIVTAKGGKLSHAAIVAREKGIPCVTGLEDNIIRIKNGDTLLVDANNGNVVLL